MSKSVQKTSADILPFTQSGELLRNMMDYAAVGMALVSPQEHILYANPALCAILGYDQDDVRDLRLPDIAPTDPLSSASIDFERLRAGKIENCRSECEYRRKDGSLTWVLLSASILRGESTGDPLHLILQLTDIDKQKCAEAALTYSESRWNNALEAAGQGVWDHDIRTDKMFYSPMWRLMRGYTPEENVDDAQEAWISRVHPDDRERILNIVDKQDKGEDGYDSIEYRERRKDGEYIWIYSRGRPVEWAPDGSAIRTVGTDTDVTARKEMEARLAEEKERLRVTLQSIGEGVISTDAHARIIFMNEIAEKMTGWREEQAVGKKIGEVFHSTLDPDAKNVVDVCSVLECLNSGEISRPDEYSLMTGRNGIGCYVRESASPVRTTDGAIIGAVMVFQDTTNRRKLQQELVYSATHDSLTRLPNREAFDQKFEAISADAAKHGGQHALCLIDLDHFKHVNDNGGHAAGDAILKEVANRVKSVCRHRDFAARIGGDEFAVILEDCALADAERISQKIVDIISDLRLEWSETIYRIGASIGIATVSGQTINPDSLYRSADAACYQAKAKGRNCVVIHQDQD